MVFVRAPRAGRVKTRLAQAVGGEVALDLYRCFVEDLLAATGGGAYATVVCYHPPQERAALAFWLEKRFPLWPQSGADLGERMSAAFDHAFAAGYHAALLIGSDLPDLPPAHIDEAFDRLRQHEAVIGPCHDGGFYLVGLRADSRRMGIFNEIAWSTPSVLAQTLARMNAAGMTPHMLPFWQDIDVRQDLERLAARLTRSPRSAPRTAAKLQSTGWLERSAQFPIESPCRLHYVGDANPRCAVPGAALDLPNATLPAGRGPERTITMAEEKKVKIFSLSTCSHCKSTKKLLSECTVQYDFVDVDLLDGEERAAIIKDIKQFNPKCSFPTIIIGDKVIVGFKEQEIREALGQ